MLDETSKIIAGSSKNLAMETTAKHERECPVLSTTSTTPAMRQNSNNENIKSCTNTINVASPNNSSDHSNSSNISPNISKAIDNGTTDAFQDLNNPISGNKSKPSLSSLTNVKEEENDKSVKPLAGSSTPAINSLSSAKDETDGINNLICVKKEEGNVSPEMSPAGFGSIANLSNNSLVEVRSCTPVKLDEVLNTNAMNMCNNNSTNSNSNDKLASVLGSTNSGSNGCAEDSLSVTAPASSISNISSDACIGGSHHPSVNLINNINNSGGSIANCMEYMQQQNHIFVFSTQLANKGAESVLSGQFPTIIAYHCTQPATKNFLEDFFMKNPMKISKLQRQSTLNLFNISVGSGGPQWISGCSPGSKISQKINAVNKIAFTNLSGNLENKASLRQPNIPNFPDVPETLGGNQNDLMCWERARNNLEGVSNEAQTELKVPNDNDAVTAGSLNTGELHVSNKSLGVPDGSVGNDSGTPSLQGIKVPDENLTPQQRQHREEQLAKLKQIDQFLSNPLQGANQLSKLSADNVPGNLASLMLNLPNSGAPGIGSQISNALNPNMRNMPSNVINPNNQNVCNSENVSTVLADANIVIPDMMNACNTNKSIQIGSQPNMSCGRNGVISTATSNGSVGSMSNNSFSCHAGGNNSAGGGMSSAPGANRPSSPEMVSNFIGDANLNNNTVKLAPSIGIHPQEVGQIGMAQMEWSKLQHHFFEERIKNNKGHGANDIGVMPATIGRLNATSIGNASLRPNMGATCASTATTNSQSIRMAQGPPPPYHPTQRSASVPIATKSPNPASPNNPTSNLSLPSPRTSGVIGIPANSPNMDVHVSTLSTTTTSSTDSTANSNANPQGKNSFQSEGSPTTSGTNPNSATTITINRNRSNQMNHFNSNPSTPLSHMSPKDLESFQTSVSAGDAKNTRPSPQRSRTPLIGPNTADTGIVEGSFPLASPGLNFPHVSNSANSGVNSYKGPCPIERQNSAPVPALFCRRTDHLPLNPNSTRTSQNKLNHSFDPISSLAQMSQQLTSCVSLNAGGVGTSTGVGNMGVLGVTDVNVPNNVNQNMDTIMGSMDAGLDHCNTSSSGNMGMPSHMNGPVPFMSNNCHINSILGPMGQRLLAPKMCGGLNAANGGLGRDGAGGLHGVMPTHRMMGRMSMNFGNFNVSPNIQVKASTPNTIQYMPVRPHNNNSSITRVPPSLEFLRYANPPLAGAGTFIDNSHMGQGNTGPPTDPNKVNHSNNGAGGADNAGMNFFGNCNQMGSMIADQEVMVGGNLIPSNEMNMGPHTSMIRCMRPIRQQHMGNPLVNRSRMQASGVQVLPGHFANGSQDPMICGDNSLFSGNGQVHGPTHTGTGVQGQGQMFSSGNVQPKSAKSIGASNIGQNVNTSNVSNNRQMSANANLHLNEPNPTMLPAINGPIIIGNNSNMVSNTMQLASSVSPVGCGGKGANGAGDVGNVGYKSFVGPSSNDLKYAQQYHSFQQQLYATSTRSQQNTGNSNIGSNVSTNPTFFLNK